MSKHIPGPWTVQPEQKTHGERLCIMREAGEVVAFTPCNVVAQDHDNARLIAAAPDLLAACQEAAEYGALTWAHDSENEPNCYRELRAAIAKATGENT